jgi:Dyp-type peroxidase family
MNLAFTFSGLDFLQVAGSNQFPQAFRDGMASRASVIGDIDANAPANWGTPIGGKNIHALMIVASDSQEDLGENVLRYVHNMGVNGGVRLVFLQEGAVRQDEPGHEHFGFRDGVSQPGVRHFDKHVKGGEPIQGNPGQDRLQPGEFLLGYPTQVPSSKKCGVDSAGKPITTDPNPDEGPISPDHTNGTETAPDWAVNGSYLVFRRLAQDVGKFHDHVASLATQVGLTPDVMGAKIVGRYASGCPLELTLDEMDLIKAGKLPSDFDPTQGDPSLRFPDVLGSGTPNNSGNLAENSRFDNHFEYIHDDNDPVDRFGERVPRCAHIRKVYPRDSPTPGGGESDTQTHRILRRGIPFGTSFRPSLGATGHGGKFGVEEPKDRGLLFLSYQGSLVRQFEFLQQTWINNPSFPEPATGDEVLPSGDQDGTDPLIAQASPTGPFRLVTGVTAGKTVATTLTVSHFVTTTGGEYFFQPAISALFKVAGKTPPAPTSDPDVDDDGDLDDPVHPADPCAAAIKDAAATLAAAGSGSTTPSSS